MRPFFIVLAAWLACASSGASPLLDRGLTAPSAVEPYMAPALRAQVDEMRASVARQPTDSPKLLSERAALVWPWANAYSLTGRPIHPDFPWLIARITQRDPRPRDVADFGPALDWFIREFSFRDAYPDAISALQTDNLGPFEVDSHVPIRQQYVVGASIGPGGGFAVATRSYEGALSIQSDDPAGDGYVTVTSSNPDVVFERASVTLPGMFSGSLGGVAERPYFRVVSGTLEPGDVVTIITGDTQGGGAGLKLPSQSSSALRVRVFVSLTSESELFALDELPFYSAGLAATALRGFGPSIAGVDEPVRLSLRFEDRFRNRASSGFSPVVVYDGPRVVARLDDLRSWHEFEVKFAEAGPHYLTARTVDGELEGEFNPVLVEANPRQRIYWGETHGHTGFAEGAGTVDNFFRFAREDARLDFMTLSEHDLWMDDSEFEVLRRAVIEAYEPGNFLTYLGYEFTVPPALGGHHNILFRTPEARRRVERQRAPEQSLMLKTLRAENAIEDVLVIPHAHNPGRWWSTDGDLERQVEIVSNHGTFEWLGRAFLAGGTHVGFVGGSDDHIGHPGIRPLSSERSGSDNFGGLAAAVSNALDRDALFDALRARQSYATNGQRIVLQLDVNGEPMGSTIQPGHVEVQGRVVGTGPIWRIDLVRNGETVASREYFDGSTTPTGRLDLRLDSETDPKERRSRSRGWRRWQGYIEVEGAKLNGFSTPNTENVYTEFARLSGEADNRVEFFIRTRGAPKNLELDLSDIDPDAAVRLLADSGKDGRIERVIPIGDLPAGGLSIDAPSGKHMDSLALRWVSPSPERDRQFSFDLDDASPEDTFYVRVLQRNGGMAWSSPVKVAATR